VTRRTAALIAAAVAALALALAGCGSGGDGASAPPSGTTPATTSTGGGTSTAPAATTAQATIPVDVFFIRDERVAPASRQVAPPAVARGAMETLLTGPTAEDQADGLTSSIPAGTRLLGLRITPAGVAEVDLSGEFASGGGSLSMLTRIAQVVYTLTSFPTVRSVRFLIDGERVEAIGGEGVTVDHPLTRADVAGQAP
jgi:spore germination protein GerM